MPITPTGTAVERTRAQVAAINKKRMRFST